ncbi:polypeptide deformylase (plasmid) [Legionella adelaidensis]|uniref:Peptide deformylase n=1 Tax=Legionella adelaidensis TaxID=45056 RepID=A0A0W0R3Q8_9GAMM|nr:peptide deformylase [Legionella adelaidensis]KTC65685.1 polypeptide deformylase [Legionella adelaidensis]VEH85967.1 polypeptide deformylase [Legionella adelaidensis]
MSNYDILQIGNPILRKISTPIQTHEFGTEELKKLSDLLFKILIEHKGVGLASPQIGINKRAIVFGMKQHPIHKHLPSIPYTVLFNPSYTPISDTIIENYEGCFSVGELRGKVPRFKSICYRGYDFEGNFVEREVSDLHARVVQHEYDHLEGILFIDKIQNFASLGFKDELLKSGELLQRPKE